MELSEIPELIKGFLLSPTETFRKVRKTETGEAFKYLAILAAIFSVLKGVTTIAQTNRLMESVAVIPKEVVGIAAIPLNFVAAIAGTIIGGVILHIFVYIVGGREGIGQTIKAEIYAQTPNLLLGWIPFIGAITGIWSVVLEVIGIRELQKLSTGRAILAVLLPVTIAIVLAFLVSMSISQMAHQMTRIAGI